MSKVLVVDDDPDFAEITRLILKAKGYEVETATSGDMALRMMREVSPDLVLLDVMMASVLDGLDVAHTMREDAGLRRIPVIMVSSIASSRSAELFPTDEYVPIDMWISKPVQPDDLLAKVARLLGTGARETRNQIAQGTRNQQGHSACACTGSDRQAVTPRSKE